MWKFYPLQKCCLKSKFFLTKKSSKTNFSKTYEKLPSKIHSTENLKLDFIYWLTVR